MKIFVGLMLIGSLLANAWLWQRRAADRDAALAMRVVKTPVTSAALAPSAGAAKTARAVAGALAGADLAALRDELQAAGADAPTVRALMKGVLQRRYEAQAAAWRTERIRTTWWRGANPAANDAGAPSWRALVTEPLQKLLGPDPLDVADAERNYDFLPPEKRRLLALIDLDYIDLQSLPNRSGSGTKADQDEYDLLVRERKKDILAALNPEERAEYEFRSSTILMNAGRRFAAMDATESEFRTIVPMITALNEQVKTLRPGAPGYAEARTGLEQGALDRLVATLGYE
ncbi:MAG: hypothetical protein ABIR80_18420, partial [Opitutaceae bacterium]